MIRLVVALIVVLTSPSAGAQEAEKCPSGPFSCVPWGPTDGTPPPRPPRPRPAPPPFFEVVPEFIIPEGFSGWLGLGTDSSISLFKGRLPDHTADLLDGFKPWIDRGKIYVIQTPGDSGSSYMLFKGDAVR